MQQNMFVNKMFKFGDGNNKRGSLYESSMNDNYGHRSKQKFMNNFDINFEDDIEEVEDEYVNEPETGLRKNSLDLSRKMHSFKRVKSQLLENTQINEYRKEESKLSDVKPKKFKTTKKRIISNKELISDDTSFYDKSDYEQTLRCGTIVEPDNNIDTNLSDRKLSSINNKYISINSIYN